MVNITPSVQAALDRKPPPPKRTSDQGFTSYGAKLITTAAPFDPSTSTGNKNDTARYAARPGVDFLCPWLAVEDGVAFQWPLGVEGFSLTNDPKTAVHSFIGDNGVRVDVLNLSEEHITLSGNFLGTSAPELIQALRTVVLADAGKSGSKILYVPKILPHSVRCQVVHSEFSRNDSDRGYDAAYSIEFVFVGAPVVSKGGVAVPKQQTTAPKKGNSSRSVTVNAAHNTLRKLAAWKLGSASNWRQLYNANETWFTKRNIQIAKAPDYRLPIGAVFYY